MVSTALKPYVWPAAPYKGLSFYSPEDAALFAGRDEDVQRCAEVIAHRATRILVLHGTTGCGKSSFLRAGLIPFLEQEEAGFQFLKDKEAKYKALFVRSTDRPLAKLAEAVYEFARADLTVETPFGSEALGLPETVAAYASRTEFLNAADGDAGVLIRTLGDIAAKVPKTLVLVIDQGEEVLTLKRGAEGEPYRREFADFISRFGKSRIDLKLLLALRTDYYGRFVNRFMGGAGSDAAGIKSYLLEELDRNELLSAIKRPTLRQDVGGYGQPYEQYRFSFEPGLPESIADDLLRSGLAGGVLLAMQIVCDSLYRGAKARQDDPVITRDSYLSLGGFEGQLGRYVDGVLGSLSELKAGEGERWKDVLSNLAERRADNTVTTKIVTAEALRESARKAGCDLSLFEEVAHYLCGDTRRVLRHTEVVNLGTGQPTDCYSLGHDAIGLVLMRWADELRQAEVAHRRRRLVFFGAAAALFLLAALLLILAPWMPWLSQLIFFGLVVPLGLLAAAPRRLLERTIFPAVLLALSPLLFLSRRLLALFTRQRPAEALFVSDDFYNRGAKYFLAAMLLATGFFGVLQTRWFVSLMPAPETDVIRENMAESQMVQDRIAETYKASAGRTPERGIVVSNLFSSVQRKMLEDEKAFLMNEHDLEDTLKARFGRSFSDVNALIIPGWELIRPLNSSPLGLTDSGAQVAKPLLNNPNKRVGGFTLRDRLGYPQVTIDGRPRIVVEQWAFGSRETLRLALLHEFLHAMNVPGYYPSSFTYLQDDLTYLPEYRNYVSRQGSKNEVAIWVTLVFIPWLISLLILRSARRRRSPASLQLLGLADDDKTRRPTSDPPT